MFIAIIEVELLKFYLNLLQCDEKLGVLQIFCDFRLFVIEYSGQGDFELYNTVKESGLR